MSAANRGALTTLLRTLVGLIFIVAAIGKVLRPDIQDTILGDLIVGNSHIALILIVVLEFGAGAALVLGLWPRVVCWTSAVALCAGLTLLVVDEIGGVGRPCGCIGEVEHSLFPTGFWWSAARSVALVAALLYVAAHSTYRPPCRMRAPVA